MMMMKPVGCNDRIALLQPPPDRRSMRGPPIGGAEYRK
jgi:hypothetical protein